MSSEEAINTVRQLYATGEESVVKIAEEVIDIALDKGMSVGLCYVSVLSCVVIPHSSLPLSVFFVPFSFIRFKR